MGWWPASWRPPRFGRLAGGAAEYTTASGAKASDDLDNAGAETTINTTVDHMVAVTVQWNSASTTRSLTTKIATVMYR